jgi:hypothetical protein
VKKPTEPKSKAQRERERRYTKAARAVDLYAFRLKKARAAADRAYRALKVGDEVKT